MLLVLLKPLHLKIKKIVLLTMMLMLLDEWNVKHNEKVKVSFCDNIYKIHIHGIKKSEKSFSITEWLHIFQDNDVAK
jgi:hypothetical protein